MLAAIRGPKESGRFIGSGKRHSFHGSLTFNSPGEKTNTWNTCEAHCSYTWWANIAWSVLFSTGVWLYTVEYDSVYHSVRARGVYNLGKEKGLHTGRPRVELLPYTVMRTINGLTVESQKTGSLLYAVVLGQNLAPYEIQVMCIELP